MNTIDEILKELKEYFGCDFTYTENNYNTVIKDVLIIAEDCGRYEIVYDKDDEIVGVDFKYKTNCNRYYLSSMNHGLIFEVLKGIMSPYFTFQNINDYYDIILLFDKKISSNGIYCNQDLINKKKGFIGDILSTLVYREAICDINKYNIYHCDTALINYYKFKNNYYMSFNALFTVMFPYFGDCDYIYDINICKKYLDDLKKMKTDNISFVMNNKDKVREINNKHKFVDESLCNAVLSLNTIEEMCEALWGKYNDIKLTDEENHSGNQNLYNDFDFVDNYFYTILAIASNIFNYTYKGSPKSNKSFYDYQVEVLTNLIDRVK